MQINITIYQKKTFKTKIKLTLQICYQATIKVKP